MGVPPGRPARLLVVIADDFGIGVETSRGIIDAARDGPVTGTSALVVAEACEASLPLLERAPGLELGLHVALTGGFRPVVATRASGFVGRDGRFGTLAGLFVACAMVEWRALTTPEHRAVWAGLSWPRGGKSRLREWRVSP